MADDEIEIEGKFWQKDAKSKKYFIAKIDDESIFVLAEDVTVKQNGAGEQTFTTTEAAINDARERAKKFSNGGGSNFKGSSKKSSGGSVSVDMTETNKLLSEIRELQKSTLQAIQSLRQMQPPDTVSVPSTKKTASKK
jgi:hypothetical protein